MKVGENGGLIGKKLFHHLIKARLNGEIHSLFAHSFNIKFGTLLVNVTDKKEYLTPSGMVAAKTIVDEITKRCPQGAIVSVRNGAFTVFGEGMPVRFGVLQMRQVDLSIGRKEVTKESLTGLTYRLLEEIEFASQLGLSWDTHLIEKTKELIELDEHSDSESLIAFFAGRGRGLTPSGDDILIGYTAIQLYFGQKNYWRRAFLERDTWPTTDVSISFFQGLKNAEVSFLLAQLINNIESQDCDERVGVINTIRTYGHSSGHDTLFGVFLGLKSLQKLI